MSDFPRLDRSAEWTGYWWLPNAPDDAVPGVLRYAPDSGLALSLIGGFQDRVMRELEGGGLAYTGTVSDWPVIQGLAENKQITLMDCHPGPSAGSLFADRPAKQVVSAQTALVGVHVSGDEDAAFTGCLVSVENLKQWANTSVFNGTLGRKDGRLNGKGSISVAPAHEPHVEVDGVTITLSHSHTLPFYDSLRGETVGRIRDRVFVRFTPEQPWHFKAALDHARAVQDLLSLATHRACALLWLSLRMPPEDRDYPDGYPVHDREVAVYLCGTVLGDAEAAAVKPSDVLFTCEHVPFEEAMPRWLEVRRRFSAASNMVLALRYHPDQYLESRLLTAVGSAEVMHRALRIDEPPIAENEFKPLRERLLDATPEQYREWLKGKLRNDPTLRDRLIALAGLPDSEAMARLVPDVEHWAARTSRARNGLAHTGQTAGHSVEELITVVRVTSAVVVLNLLQALGVPAERQRELLNDNGELRHTAENARTYLLSAAPDGT